MIRRIREAAYAATRSEDLQQVGITYAGQFVASGIGFVIQVFLQKEMGPAEYGVLGLAMSIGSLSVVLTDLGLSHAMVRFGSKYRVVDRQRLAGTLSAALVLRLGLNLLVATIGFAVSSYVAVIAFEEPDLIRPLRWVYLVMVGQVLFGFWVFFTQTLQRFKTRSVVMVCAALFRVLFFVLLFLWYRITPTAAVIVDGAASLTGFLVGMMLSPRGVLRAGTGEIRRAAAELIPYCRFTGVLMVGGLLFNELDTLMLGAFADKEVVGLYRAAWTYAMVMGLLNQSVANVLFSKITSISSPTELSAYAWKTLKLTSGLAVLTLPAPVFVSWWIPWYEPRYSGAVTIFYIMYAGMIVDLVMGPMGYVLYSLDRPGVMTKVSLVKIVANAAANLVLIPPFGAVGAAAATLATRLLGGGLNSYVVVKALRKGD